MIKHIENKIPNLATTATLNDKINEVKGEIPSINGLASTQPTDIGPHDVRGRHPPTFPGCTLKFIFDNPGDVLI